MKSASDDEYESLRRTWLLAIQHEQDSPAIPFFTVQFGARRPRERRNLLLRHVQFRIGELRSAEATAAKGAMLQLDAKELQMLDEILGLIPRPHPGQPVLLDDHGV